MQQENKSWEWHEGNGPVIGIALHAGHEIRRDLQPILAIDEETRLREEDPYTDRWARCCDAWVVVNRSRFELDLNRPQDQAIYCTPDQSWGLKVWSSAYPAQLFAKICNEHTRFYHELDNYLERLARRFGAFVILDMHSYNHRREGPNTAFGNPAFNPGLNVGTGSLDRGYWEPLIDGFIEDMRGSNYRGKPMDVRENIKFRGRYLAEHVHRKFPGVGCVLALEFKKTFMDEWTGIPDMDAVTEIESALRFSIAGLQNSLITHYGCIRHKNVG